MLWQEPSHLGDGSWHGELGNIEFLRDGGRRHIIGTPKSMLKKFEQDILKDDWHSIRDGREVKFVTMPASDSECSQNNARESSAESHERFILSRSRERSKKEEGITQRCEKKIVEGFNRMKTRYDKRDPMTVEREIGRPLGQNTRAAKVCRRHPNPRPWLKLARRDTTYG